MWRDFYSGGKLSVPIVVVYLILGVAAGALGASRGLSVAEIALLSLLLFAGSAQFVFPEIYEGAPRALASAVFFINLRHLLYSTALAQQARRLSPRARAAIGAQLTDETFLVATAHLRGKMIPSGAWMIGLNFCSYLAWCGGNVCGALVGGALDLSVVGADFAGAAMFIALLVPQITGHARTKAAIAVAAVAGIAACIAQTMFAGAFGGVMAAVLAAAAGAAIFGDNESDREFAEMLRAEDDTK